MKGDVEQIFNEIACVRQDPPLLGIYVRPQVRIDDLDLPNQYKELFTTIIDYIEDPVGQFGDVITVEDIKNCINQLEHPKLIGLSEAEDLSDKMKTKGNKFDGIVGCLVRGAAGRMSVWGEVEDLDLPIALRSIAKRKIMKACEEQGRDYYYIDTGYFGNQKRKEYHRVTKNAMQYLGPIEDRPGDRLERCGVRIKKMKPGSKILICPPSQKAMNFWGLEVDKWMDETVSTIKQYTDRPIEIRLKGSRSARQHNTIEQALADDVHCMVTFNSIAAVESLIYGKPVFTMGPNAAHHLANHDLSFIETPYVPTAEEVYALLSCLAYHQFTTTEMTNGYAWAILTGEA